MSEDGKKALRESTGLSCVEVAPDYLPQHDRTLDPLHNSTGPDVFWTTTNVGEALPGVLTPLGWTLFGTVGDHCTREAFYRVGAYTRAERRQPVSFDDRLVRVF